MTFIFDGFDPANTTPVPDVFFDVLLPHLNEAQLKVMLYIIRRTLGFKKTADAISLRQFRYGITTKNKVTGEEKQLDSGCGLKNFTTISKALKSLEPMNCIERAPSKTDAGDDDTTVYRILFRGTTANVVPTTANVVPSYAERSTPTTPNGARVLRQTEPQLNSNTRDSLQETVLQGGVLATSLQEDRNAPLSLELKREEKQKTNPRMPALTVSSHSQGLSETSDEEGDKDLTTKREAIPKPPTGDPDLRHTVDVLLHPELLHTPGTGPPPMALSARAIKAQNEKRKRELWAIVEEERKTTYSKTQRELYENDTGMNYLIEDDISDEVIRAGLQALSLYERRTFTVQKFYGWLPNLSAKAPVFLKKASNGHQSDMVEWQGRYMTVEEADELGFNGGFGAYL